MWISEIGWDIKTSITPGAGTDSQLTVDILRDDQSVIQLNVEPGETSRLDRDESQFYFWRFVGATPEPSNSNIGEVESGQENPHGVEFENDIFGHLKCRLRIYGDDMWIKQQIDGYVRYAKLQGVPGTIDSANWVDDPDWTPVGNFAQEAHMSTDGGEGYTNWTLLY